ncbi:MAG TPA: ELM1/GtrOC1 family putative glycosyltransferase, partial [Sphingobium sp.]
HRHLAAFDLVIAPPQFALPARPNILPLTTPLFALDAGMVADEARLWAPRFADLPRPLTAILLGGPQPPFRFDSTVARDIVRRAARQADGGTLLILTSRRTPPAVVDALRRSLPGNARLFSWNEKAARADKASNPYRAVLGLADRFVVSGDSISMIGEVLSLGKALAIAPAPFRRAPHIRLEQAIARRFRAASTTGNGIWSRLKRHCHARGILPFARDFTSFHETLIRRGLAVPLGMPFRQPPLPATRSDTADAAAADVAAISARIRALLGAATEASGDASRR